VEESLIEMALMESNGFELRVTGENGDQEQRIIKIHLVFVQCVLKVMKN